MGGKLNALARSFDFATKRCQVIGFFCLAPVNRETSTIAQHQMSHQHRPSVAVQERVIQEGLGSGLAMAWDVAETKREGRAKRAGLARLTQRGLSRMSVILRRPRAQDDITDIWCYIAEDSEIQAAAFVDRLAA